MRSRPISKNQEQSYRSLLNIAHITCSTMGLHFKRGTALDDRSVNTMETNRINAATPNTSRPTSTLLPHKPKIEPNAPEFLQALAEAVDAATSKTVSAEPAIISRHLRPRSHLDLVTLNPVQTTYVPEPAALERIGKSRILPSTAGG